MSLTTNSVVLGRRHTVGPTGPRRSSTFDVLGVPATALPVAISETPKYVRSLPRPPARRAGGRSSKLPHAHGLISPVSAQLAWRRAGRAGRGRQNRPGRRRKHLEDHNIAKVAANSSWESPTSTHVERRKGDHYREEEDHARSTLPDRKPSEQMSGEPRQGPITQWHRPLVSSGRPRNALENRLP